jgi:hypothetical protein
MLKLNNGSPKDKNVGVTDDVMLTNAGIKFIAIPLFVLVVCLYAHTHPLSKYSVQNNQAVSRVGFSICTGL